jgi:ParB family transcriptional regulator, chromosome partitioning protein
MAATIEKAIYWLELDKIVPNPYQPRKEFDPIALSEMAESIRQYGILQPLIVSRMEDHKEDGSINVIYQLIAGERRLRASRIAGLVQVPCVIRIGDDNREKLELAIVENVVRDDLNPVERAMAYRRLADEFNISWIEISKKVGKSREYISNTVRILMLPQDILDAITKGKITEGHTRPLLMLIDKPEEMMTLFKEMMIRKMTVREAERISRKIAFEKVRKKSTMMTPEVVDMEEGIASALGTRVTIEPKEKGGKIMIDYFTPDELHSLSRLLRTAGEKKVHKGMFDVMREENESMLESKKNDVQVASPELGAFVSEEVVNVMLESDTTELSVVEYDPNEHSIMSNDIGREEERLIGDIGIDDYNKSVEEDGDIYNINKFTI